MAIEHLTSGMNRPSADEQAVLTGACVQARRCLEAASTIMTSWSHGTLNGHTADQVIALAAILSARINSRGG